MAERSSEAEAKASHAETKTLTRVKLAEALVKSVGLSGREAKDFVEQFFEEISNALARGESVKLSGFGHFQLRDKAERPGRNPKTGEPVPVTPRRVVTFHAGRKLRNMVEKRGGDPPKDSDDRSPL